MPQNTTAKFRSGLVEGGKQHSIQNLRLILLSFVLVSIPLVLALVLLTVVSCLNHVLYPMLVNQKNAVIRSSVCEQCCRQSCVFSPCSSLANQVGEDLKQYKKR